MLNGTHSLLHKPGIHVSCFHLDDNIRDILYWLIFTGVCQAIAIFGTGTNVVNIVCFVKQGLSDPVNISLLGLAISDLGSLITIVWTDICLTPALRNADLPFYPIEFQQLTTAWPHTVFVRIISWITAVITMERCLCITVPLKVKNVVTPRRVFIIIISVYTILIAAIIPLYFAYNLDWKYFVDRNKSLIGLVYTEYQEVIEPISFLANNVCLPFGAFVIIIICTTILVIKLYVSTKWRQKATSSLQLGTYNRNLKIAKMVIVISALFIACFFPMSAIFIGILLDPCLSIAGEYHGIVYVLMGVCATLESVNSSVNIFIYYRMSGRYKAMFIKTMYKWSACKLTFRNKNNGHK